jgi:hypothetical protein
MTRVRAAGRRKMSEASWANVCIVGRGQASPQ